MKKAVAGSSPRPTGGLEAKCVGAVAGGLAGKGAVESIDPTVEDTTPSVTTTIRTRHQTQAWFYLYERGQRTDLRKRGRSLIIGNDL
jgi:outer membrane lipoprotein SlyB